MVRAKPHPIRITRIWLLCVAILSQPWYIIAPFTPHTKEKAEKQARTVQIVLDLLYEDSQNISSPNGTRSKMDFFENLLKIGFCRKEFNVR